VSFDFFSIISFLLVIFSSPKKVDTTTTTTKKAISKVPEVLLKKRKLYADLKAKRLRSQVQATKVNPFHLLFLNSSF
jgi:hypothetical protein